MTLAADAESAVADLRPLVQGDGADLELRHVDESSRTVTIGLVLDGVECLECVMPPDFLHQIVTQAVTDKLGGATLVLEDPRQA
jgi:Fe-S cluster biogenesis protein NfuA